MIGSQQRIPPADERLRRMAAYFAAAFLGAACSLVAVVLGIRWLGPGSLPPVTAEVLRQAQARWAETQTRDYDVEVQVQGRAAAAYVVSVRGGEVRAATRDGRPLTQQRTWNTWSVPGMFETIQRDLEVVARAREGKSAPGEYPLDLRGRFDPDWGFPRRYQRVELRRFGANEEIVWEVTGWHLPGPTPERMSAP